MAMGVFLGPGANVCQTLTVASREVLTHLLKDEFLAAFAAQFCGLIAHESKSELNMVSRDETTNDTWVRHSYGR